MNPPMKSQAFAISFQRMPEEKTKKRAMAKKKVRKRKSQKKRVEMMKQAKKINQARGSKLWSRESLFR